jgi:predicted MFS family arabinose efflux permease
MMLGTAADAGVFIFLTVYLQQRQGLSPLQTTAVLIVPGLAAIGAGRLAGGLITAYGAQRSLVVSLALQATAIGVIAERAPSLLVVVVGTTIAAGAYVAACVCAAILATTPITSADGGLAGSLVNASEQLGTALGVAVVTSLVGAGQLARSVGPEARGSGVWPVMLAGAVLAASGALVASRLSPRATPSTGMFPEGERRE